MSKYDELKRMAEHTNDLCGNHDGVLMHVTTAAIMALIAENERLEREAKNDLIAYKAVIERQNELRAESAGLKTGYQAYERVNAELKAENEALRTALRPLLTHWDDVKPGESMNVDRARSAMRWGECP